MKRFFAHIFLVMAGALMVSPLLAEQGAVTTADTNAVLVKMPAEVPAVKIEAENAPAPVTRSAHLPTVKSVAKKKKTEAATISVGLEKERVAQDMSAEKERRAPLPMAAKMGDESAAMLRKADAQILPQVHSLVEPADYGHLPGSASEKKKKELIDLVRKGVDIIQKKSLAQALDAINRSPEFKKSEFYLYVYDIKGVLLANGDDMSEVWKNQYAERDEFGIYPVRGLIEKALKGGGWHIYHWRNATKVAYVMLTEKNGQKYVVGGGYYPLSKAEYVMGLVKSAVSTYKWLLDQGYSKETVWGMFSYPLGKFVYGDLFLMVLGSKGEVLANGQNPAMVGELLWDEKDGTGAYVTRSLISRLNKKLPEEGVWIESREKNALKKIYVERVVEKQGESVYIMSSYFPDANREAVTNLVRKGSVLLSTFGSEEAARKINHAELLGNGDASQTYVYGDLTLFVYDMQGNCIAHGENSELVGKNLIEMRDSSGHFMVKELIEKAKRDGTGWVDFVVKNAFWNVYFERVDIGKQSYVIGSGLYPIGKREMMTLMVKSAADYLRDNEEKKAFYDFGSEKGMFIRGDLRIFVFDTTGICYVWGDLHNLVWQNLFAQVDQDGRPYVKIIINTVKNGAGTVTSRENNARKTYYAEPVVKGDKTYIVGSSYYQ